MRYSMHGEGVFTFPVVFPIIKLPAEGLTAGRTGALITVHDISRAQRIENILRNIRFRPAIRHRLLKIFQLQLGQCMLAFFSHRATSAPTI